MTSAYVLVERVPAVAEYNRVRQAAGLTIKNEIAAARGLANTLYCACIEYSNEVVGIGRVKQFKNRFQRFSLSG